MRETIDRIAPIELQNHDARCEFVISPLRLSLQRVVWLRTEMLRVRIARAKCSPNSVGADFSIFVDASQRHGRPSVTGSADFQGQCDGTTQRWIVVVAPEKGKFTGGKIETTSFGVASTPGQGIGTQIVQTVRLRGKSK